MTRRKNKDVLLMMRMMNQTLIRIVVIVKKKRETPCKTNMMIFKMENFWKEVRGRPPRSVTSL